MGSLADNLQRFLSGLAPLLRVLAYDNLVLAALPDAIVVSMADDRSGASRLRMLMSTIQEDLGSARADVALRQCDFVEQPIGFRRIGNGIDLLCHAALLGVPALM
jgi:hypothetical protein